MHRPFSPSPTSEESLSGWLLRSSGASHSESRLANRSFRLILYLEWILLGVAFLLVIRPTRLGIDTTAQILVTLILVGFGLMGLKLPTQRTYHKVLYTALELGLLLVTFLLDRRTGFFPLLGLIIVIRSCLIFQQAGRLIVTGLVFISSLLILFLGMPPVPRPRPRHPISSESIANTILTLNINTAITFGLTLLFILILVNALLAERQSREKLLLANEQLRQYALRIEDQAKLQERNRIAREIHDALGHALTAQSIQLENALLFLPPDAEKTRSFLEESQRLGARALQEVRRSIATLRSDPLQGRSLEGAIAKAITEFQTSTGIAPHYTLQLSQPIPTEISTALYRIIQESLTNIYKHSAATQVSIDLQQSYHTIHLQIGDNGQGFDPERNTTGFGLQGMRERTTALGGQFQLSSQPGKGCRITVSIPLPQQVL
ncbi:MAG TPA: two-component sensor histidine kinase [Cyanobacteria bacterium UBA8803]|nr:two-component sensor histidine kinase [Cyanobacteria bacterium UBA9273]HBL61121.1 two-component sensor histidine kinase [Cyanobacteria bacterium UBA8803]